jgi:hypothetical protein
MDAASVCPSGIDLEKLEQTLIQKLKEVTASENWIASQSVPRSSCQQCSLVAEVMTICQEYGNVYTVSYVTVACPHRCV